MRCVILAACLALVAVPAVAKQAETKSGYAACVTEEYFSQWVKASAGDDEAGKNYLLENKLCFGLKAGVPVSVLDTSWTGRAHIRVYAKGQSAELWTYAEAIDD